MSVRRYRARDMRDAMRQVREHQGPDAVILSSRRVDGMLEVVASLDPAPGSAAATREPAPARPVQAAPVDPELAAMRRELYDLRSLLVRQQVMSEQDQWAATNPVASDCSERLQRCGFPEKLARSLVGSIHEDTSSDMAWSRLRTRISASIATVTPTVLEQGGMLALVGTTGVGKTTTITRLALRHLRRMGRDSVIIATLDRQRIGAYKQLQTFGQMAGVPVMLLESERDLTSLSSRAREGKLILIDTEGQAARDAAERKLFAQIRHQVQLQTWLVIAATHQAAGLRQILQSFQSCEPSALVLTKVDEAGQLGETLSVLLEQRLGLAFYSDGQRLEEDFHKADTEYLTRLALQEPAWPTLAPEPLRAMPISEPAMPPLQQTPLNRMPFGSQTRVPEASMVLEQVVPFRKRVHAAH